MSWVRLNSISIDNNSKTITVNGGTSTSNIKPGDALQIGEFGLAEIEGVFANQLVLTMPWPHATQNEVTGVVLPTFGDFNQAVEALRTATTITHGNYAEMERWWTEDAVVTFKDYSGQKHQVRSAKKMESDVQALEQRLENNILQGNAAFARTLADYYAERKQGEHTFVASGIVNSGGMLSSGLAINEGLYSIATESNALFMGGHVNNAAANAVSRAPKTIWPEINIRGHVLKVMHLNDANVNKLKLEPAPDGRDTFNSDTGEIVRHASAAEAFAAETNSNKVVTAPYDLQCFEVFLAEITAEKPEAYPFGVVQSKATEMNGVATSESSRPDSYHAAYKGDTTSGKQSVDFFNSSVLHKDLWAGDPDNRLFWDAKNKRWLQERLRHRSIRGAGNGNWQIISTNASSALSFSQEGANTFVDIQGDEDTVQHFKSDTSEIYVGSQSGFRAVGDDTDRGVFAGYASAGVKTSRAVDGECYLLPIAMVSRLNLGVYHPSNNPEGTARVQEAGFGWLEYTSNRLPSGFLSSKLDCFSKVQGNFNVRIETARGGMSGGTSLNGRIGDRRFHDEIGASGQGGVQDLRFFSWFKSSVEYLADAIARLISGEYRGRENLVRTILEGNVASSSGSPSFTYQSGGIASRANVGDLITIVDGIDIVVDKAKITSISGNNIVWSSSDGTYNRVSGTTYYAVIEQETNQAVDGKFQQLDVFAPPSQVLATPDFANGWLGSWRNRIFDGENRAYQFSRDSDDEATVGVVTVNNGNTWSSATRSIDAVTNSFSSNSGTPSVEVHTYTASAKLTKPSQNKPVLNGVAGILGVQVYNGFFSDKWGALLQESLIGVIATTSLNTKITTLNSLIEIPLRPIDQMIDVNPTRRPVHSPVTVSGTSTSIGMKFLAHLIDDGHLNLNFIANEIKHNGTNWGDDGELRVGNEDFSNGNGETCRAVIHELAIPMYWWRKNDV